MRTAFGVAWIVALCASTAAAQTGGGSVFERLNLDKLQLYALGASAGPIMPSQVVSTTVYALSADYGEISRNWRVIFGVSYWESRYEDDVVRTFVDSLQHNLDDPSGRARVVASPVTLYDVTFGAELRFTPVTSADLKPYFGVGLAGHVINAEGKLIKGTFVERSLDDIAAGLFVTTGIQLRIVPHFGVEGGVRGDLLSGFRSVQARAGATYYFGRLRRPGRPSPT
jgi:hypothetical protein